MTYTTRYAAFSGIMGVYAASRGFRANTMWDSHENKLIPVKKLIGDRLIYGVANGVLYSLPFWNVYGLFRLMNRVEIRYRGWDTNTYRHEFKEVDGYCASIF